MKDEEPVEQPWDVKKIVFATVFLILFLGGAFWVKANILDAKQSPEKTIQPPTWIEGASTQSNDSNSSENQDAPPPSVVFSPGSLQDDAQQKLNQIKAQVTNLSIQDIASSSPQVQKVLNDVKALEEYPKDQAKQMCENICKSL